MIARRSVLLSAVIALPGCTATPLAGVRAPCVERQLGTFYQPLLAHQSRSPARWNAWAAELAGLGVRRLVLQHASLEPHDVLVPPPGEWRAGPGGTMLVRILDAAALHGLRVWLGLSYDPAFWKATADPDLDRLRQYAARRVARQRAVAQALRPATAHPGVAGWYISDEIDDLTWQAPERAAILAPWLEQVTRMLRATASSLPIAVSGFVHGDKSSSPTPGAQWGQWLDAAPQLDEVLLQDGIGAGSTSLANWPQALDEVRAVAASRGRRCTPVVELFEPVAGGGPPFRAARVERVVQQLRVAQARTTQVMTFSLPEYALSDGEAARQLRAYFGETCRADDPA